MAYKSFFIGLVISIATTTLQAREFRQWSLEQFKESREMSYCEVSTKAVTDGGLEAQLKVTLYNSDSLLPKVNLIFEGDDLIMNPMRGANGVTDRSISKSYFYALLSQDEEYKQNLFIPLQNFSSLFDDFIADREFTIDLSYGFDDSRADQVTFSLMGATSAMNSAYNNCLSDQVEKQDRSHRKITLNDLLSPTQKLFIELHQNYEGELTVSNLSRYKDFYNSSEKLVEGMKATYSDMLELALKVEDVEEASVAANEASLTLQTLKDEIASSKNEERVLKNSILDLQQSLETSEVSIEALNSEIPNLEDAEQEANENNQTAKDKYEPFRQELISLEEIKQVKVDYTSTIQQALERNRELYSASEESIVNINDNLDQSYADYDQYIIDRDNTSDELDELEERINNFTVKKEILRAGIKRNGRVVLGARRNDASVQYTFNELKVEVRSLKVKMTQMSDDISNWEKANKTKNKITEKESELKSIQASKVTLQNDITRANRWFETGKQNVLDEVTALQAERAKNEEEKSGHEYVIGTDCNPLKPKLKEFDCKEKERLVKANAKRINEIDKETKIKNAAIESNNRKNAGILKNAQESLEKKNKSIQKINREITELKSDKSKFENSIVSEASSLKLLRENRKEVRKRSEKLEDKKRTIKIAVNNYYDGMKQQKIALDSLYDDLVLDIEATSIDIQSLQSDLELEKIELNSLEAQYTPLLGRKARADAEVSTSQFDIDDYKSSKGFINASRALSLAELNYNEANEQLTQANQELISENQNIVIYSNSLEDKNLRLEEVLESLVADQALLPETQENYDNLSGVLEQLLADQQAYQSSMDKLVEQNLSREESLMKYSLKPAELD